MDYYVRWFIRASLLWLGAGVVLGVLMAVGTPQMIAYRPAHMHANLLGFVSMMIFGVAYHVIPRFSGAPLHGRRLAGIHLVLANAGLLSMVLSWLLRAHALAGTRPLLAVGALLSAAGAFLFIYNIWRTLDAGAQPVRLSSAGPPQHAADRRATMMQSQPNGARQ